MSSRFLIPVLCVGAVAFACGPRTHNEASEPRGGATTVAHASTDAALQQQGAPLATPRSSRKTPKPALGATLLVDANGSAVHFALQVVNNTKKRMELTFPSGQTHDFVVLDSAGREVWRWGTGRMFTQSLRNKLLGGGETMDLEETMRSAQLPAGRYVARGTLTSQNYPLVQETEFTVRATTVASR